MSVCCHGSNTACGPIYGTIVIYSILVQRSNHTVIVCNDPDACVTASRHPVSIHSLVVANKRLCHIWATNSVVVHVDDKVFVATFTSSICE